MDDGMAALKKNPSLIAFEANSNLCEHVLRQPPQEEGLSHANNVTVGLSCLAPRISSSSGLAHSQFYRYSLPRQIVRPASCARVYSTILLGAIDFSMYMHVKVANFIKKKPDARPNKGLDTWQSQGQEWLSQLLISNWHGSGKKWAFLINH